MSDDLTSLDKALRDGNTPPVTLVFGEERLLVDQAVARLVAAGVDEPTDPLTTRRVDLDEPGSDPRDVFAACQSMGLFASRQAVVVRGAEVFAKSTQAADLLKSYLEDPNPLTTLILVALKFDGNSKAYRATKKSGLVLKFATPKRWQLPRWIMDQSRSMGHGMDEPTAHLIADMSGTSLQGLRLVIDQLSLYVGPGQPITSQVVEGMLAATRSHTVFELVDAVGDRQLTDALRHLHLMLEQREPALRILAMLVRHFRQLWQVAYARSRGADMDRIQGDLKIPPFAMKKLWRQSGRFNGVALRRSYDLLYRANLGLKSTGADDRLIMERLVMELCS